ncbi:MAG: response regulator transcription factor [Solirubrobacterales bacterium]|nr:response regulator transcription factor [Solirubrobacterales bacterium]
MRVMICEDHALVRDGLERLLSTHGFEVVASVGDTGAFLAALRAGAPDVCVLDVRLPPSFTDEGVRAALEARQMVPGLPILILSQYVEQTFARELFTSGEGGVGYLLKDRVADPSQFVEAVKRVAAGGTALDPEAVAALLSGSERQGRLALLTPREHEVLGLMAEGRSNSGIAETLVVSERAVEKHVSNIFWKLDLPAGSGDHRRVLAVLAWLRAEDGSASAHEV